MDVRLFIALCFGSCVGAPPPPAQPVALATGQFAPCGIAVDARSAYWTNGNGAVQSVPIGGGAPSMLALAQDHPCSIVADGANVYWANYSTDGQVMSLPATGGTPRVLAAGRRGPYGLTLHDGMLYWTEVTGATVMRMPAAGGDVETLATDQSVPAGIAAGGDSVFWSSVGQHSIRALLVGGERKVFTLATGQDAAVVMQFRDGAVYWANNGDGRVMVSRNALDPAQLAQGQHPDGLAVDDAHVYWADEFAGQIARVGLHGEEPAIIATDQVAPGAIVADDENIYWVNTNPSGSVMKLAK
jgi:hypothetical protein